MCRPPIDLVCFDLGGVWIRVVSDWQAAFERAGITPPADLAERMTYHHDDRMTHDHETGRITSAAFCQDAAERLNLPVEQVRAVMDAWLIEPYPNIDAIVQRLSRHNIATACLSNTSDRHWALMTDPSQPAYLPLHQLDHRFASFQMGCMKPDSQIFEQVEQVTGIAARRIVLFDDRPGNVEAARRRGWQGYVIDPTGQPMSQVAATLDELGIDR